MGWTGKGIHLPSDEPLLMFMLRNKEVRPVPKPGITLTFGKLKHEEERRQNKKWSKKVNVPEGWRARKEQDEKWKENDVLLDGCIFSDDEMKHENRQIYCNQVTGSGGRGTETEEYDKAHGYGKLTKQDKDWHEEENLLEK